MCPSQKLFKVILRNREQEDRVSLTRRDIEKLMTSTCKSCNAVFLDFEGCCVLACANPTCKVNFCAWCLKPAERGENLHPHVQACASNPYRPSYYCTQEQYAVKVRERNSNRVRDLLRAVDDEHRNRCLANSAIAQLLRELQLRQL
jgi:hypothetical protein